MRGYLPSRMRVPGGTCCVILSSGYGMCDCRGLRSGLGSTMIFARSGSSNASMRVASEGSLKINTGVEDVRGLDRDVETILHGFWCEHDARTVAVAAEDCLMEIALLDIRRKTGARAAALNVTNDQRNLGHRRPTDRFRLERNSGTGAASA